MNYPPTALEDSLRARLLRIALGGARCLADSFGAWLGQFTTPQLDVGSITGSNQSLSVR